MRELVKNGMRWRIREADAAHVPGARAARCLIVESDNVVRRVWAYPADWDELADEQIWQVIDGPVRSLPHIESAAAVSSTTRSLVAEMRVVREADRALRTNEQPLLDDCRQARERMRVAVKQYAELLRRQGVPPERALVLLKEAVHTGLSGACDDEDAADELIQEGVEWCIAAYYAA